MESKHNKDHKVVIIGWDAADWKIIRPLMEAGKMPALQWMIHNGASGNIATLHPVLSPMLWTSIATGKRPYHHGIHGFVEPMPDGSGIRPITNLSRKAKAFWNILNQQGHRGIVIGWWPSHPAEPLNGVMVSNLYPKAESPLDEPWPLAVGAVHPCKLSKQLAELRLHPQELTQEHLLPFVPHAAEIDQDKDFRLRSFLRMLAECASIHSATTWLMENETWDYLAVYHDAIDHFCHAYMRYHPPRREGIIERDFTYFKGMIEGIYRYHDLMLHTLLSKLDQDTTVIVMSDHGFHPDDLRPTRLPDEPAAPAYEHRDYGILVIKGPNVKKGATIHGANLLDIAPTLLNLFGLPIGRDMEGKPLVQAFDKTLEIKTIPSWEAVQGDAGTHPPDKVIDPVESQQALDQLVALGYIKKPDDNCNKATEQSVRELRYNLARAYIDGDHHAKAAEVLEELHVQNPAEIRFGVQLAICLQVLNRVSEMKGLLAELRRRRRKVAKTARAELEKILKKHVEAQKPQQSIAETPRRTAKAKKAEQPAVANTLDFSKIPEADQHTILQLHRKANGHPHDFAYLSGYIKLAEGRYLQALKYLRQAQKLEPCRPSLPIQIGEAHLHLKRWKAAESNFRKALDLEPENAYAHLGLCRVRLAQRRNLEAAEEALSATELLYHYPLGHYYLGVALHRLGRIAPAVQALNIALTLNPNFVEAHERLIHLYEKRLHQPRKAHHHRRERIAILSAQSTKPLLPTTTKTNGTTKTSSPSPSVDVPISQPSLPQGNSPMSAHSSEIITIVSGLPRSGTSLLMQMLHAGGFPILTDRKRQADADNPRGYLEFEKTKNLRNDQTWLPQACGKAVKIIAQLLFFLPPQFPYRIIFLYRNLDEVIASQRTMLDHQNRAGAASSPQALKETFRKQLRIIKSRFAMYPRIRSLSLDFHHIISEPKAASEAIEAFLHHPLNKEAMARVVDPQLYRHRLQVPLEVSSSTTPPHLLR